MKPILVIDDKIERLDARRESVLFAGYEDYVDFKSSVDFIKFDKNANPVLNPDFQADHVKCIFIHTSLKANSKFPESRVAKMRLILKPILVIGFSGGGETQLKASKINYEAFEKGLVRFTHILAKYNTTFLRVFEGAGVRELAIHFREELNRQLQSNHDISIKEIVKTNSFQGLLRYAGKSFEDFLKEHDPSSLQPIELARICRRLSE